jgi:hypothetical protein
MRFDTSPLPDLERFARVNGLQFESSVPAPQYGGAVFEYLRGAVVRNRFVAASGFELGTITGEISGIPRDGVDRPTISSVPGMGTTYTYLAITLERAVPQLVLDSIRNGASLPMPVEGGQSLHLEGNFDQYFRLSVPRGYEHDALYILTPDLMSLLIDETGDFDVETVDNKLFVYSVGALNLANPAVWERLGRIHSIVGSKAISQTRRYSDSHGRHAESDEATGFGQRLRMGGLPRPAQVFLWFFLAFIIIFFLSTTVFMVFFAWMWFAGIDAINNAPPTP